MSEKKIITLDKTKVGLSYRTTVPETVRKLLQIKIGDEVAWVYDGINIIVKKNLKEESVNL